MTGGLALFAGLLCASSGLAQFDDGPTEEQGQAVIEADEGALARDMQQRLHSDPAMADSLAARILRSKIGDRITAATDPQTRFQEIRKWIDQDPQTAASLGVGLAKDDANGTTSFEDMVTRTISTHLRANPNAKDGIFGRLKKQGKDSKLLKAQTEDISDEEKREILKTVFEGQGSQSSKIITQQDSGRAASGANAGIQSSYYDRLSRSNMRGYSPQLQAFQSSLNLRRPPGAPKLIETGKLDYPTLSYPVWGMRYDVNNIERRLRYERNFALAKLLGQEKKYSAQALLSTEVEALLNAAGLEAKLPPRFKRRQQALTKAAEAVVDFDAAAIVAKDSRNISPALLSTLSLKQKEAARWITIASLEEELQRLEIDEGFMTPELNSWIDRAPVPPASQQAFRQQGKRLAQSLKALIDNDAAAIKMLEGDDWLAQLEPVDKLLVANVALRRNLSRNIDLYRTTAFRFALPPSPRSRWRELLDRLVLKLLPRSSHAQAVRHAEHQREIAREAFLIIAKGDLDAAHALIASHQPPAR